MAYAFKSTLTVDHTQCGSSDSTSFPVLLLGTFNGTGSTPDLRTAANGGKIQNTVSFNGQTVPADINFYSDAAGTIAVPFEIAQYTASTGAIEVWIQRNISSSADTNIYMYYDDAAVTTYQGGSVGAAWDANFQGVYHLPDGSTLSVKDSTSNAINGTNHSATATAGQIDGAGSFIAASSQYVTLGTSSNLNITGNITVSMWINPTSQSGTTYTLARDINTTRGFGFGTNGFIYLEVNGAVVLHNTTAISNSTWTHIVFTYDGTSYRDYVNNSLSETVVAAAIPSNTDTPTEIGRRDYPGNLQYWDGLIDEVKISNSLRSVDWMTAEYNNQKTSSTFLTVGSQTAINSQTIWTAAFIKFP